MIPRSARFLAMFLITAAVVMSIQAAPAAAQGTVINLAVDASDAPRRILHATMTMPAKGGALTLFYPKWIPGEHMTKNLTN